MGTATLHTINSRPKPPYFDRFPLAFWGTVMVLSLLVCARLAARWEKLLVAAPPAFITREAGPKNAPPVQRVKGSPTTHIFQKIRESGGIISAEYGFVNFNNDPLTVSFSMSSRELAAYRLDYGYTAGEKASLDQWLKHAGEEAYKQAVRNRQSQEQLNRAGERINAEYSSKLMAFYRSRGFTVIEGNTIMVDIPEIVRRNVKKVRNVALSINSSGETLGYDSDSIITAALSLVQTAIRYENVPLESHGRQTGGLIPPLEALAIGTGDCDTKAALLGAILLNWDRVKVIGIGVPNHYLMGVLRNPAKGDVYVEHRGLRYVLVEPAGPGWLPPGTVSRETVALLNARKNLKIELFSAH